MKRMAVVLTTIAVIGGMWFLVFRTLSALEPAPLSAQVNPAGSSQSEVPTSAPIVVHLSYEQLAEQVVPPDGKTIAVRWGDMGQKLVAAGAIDLEKFEQQGQGLNDEQHEILQGTGLDHITFTPDNIRFWTNVLWALGLTQQSKVLREGPMQQSAAEIPLGSYASTGGWTLGSRDATELYNSARLIELTPEQDDLVYRVAEGIYRPCCGNSTAFPDCNHGMAVLGLLELMAAQGASEQEMLEAALVFNSYAFSQTYIILAAYFAAQDVTWTAVDPAEALGWDYSSGQGAQRIAALVSDIPGAPDQGGSCST